MNRPYWLPKEYDWDGTMMMVMARVPGDRVVLVPLSEEACGDPRGALEYVKRTAARKAKEPAEVKG